VVVSIVVVVAVVVLVVVVVFVVVVFVKSLHQSLAISGAFIFCKMLYAI
jgi:hypothetical protein